VRLEDDYPLSDAGEGLWSGEVAASPGDDYRFVLDGREAWPDPCSRWQPEGVGGPSRVLDTGAFEIAPGPGLALDELVLYELHVGTFSPEGTFDGVVPRLADLRELGVTGPDDRAAPRPRNPARRLCDRDGGARRMRLLTFHVSLSRSPAPPGGSERRPGT